VLLGLRSLGLGSRRADLALAFLHFNQRAETSPEGSQYMLARQGVTAYFWSVSSWERDII
jgi:hypothetical protein